MSVAPSEETVQKRVTAVLAELDETLAPDATIGRTELHETFDDAELPRLSMDESPLARPSAVTATPAGRRPDLQLVGLLGEGGMGAVYAARQRALNREVAVKRLRDGDVSTHTRSALLAEARVMGSLEHPNIVPVHTLGCDEQGRPVLVMKRIEGVSWRDLLEDPEHRMWSEIGGARDRGLPFHVQVLLNVCNALRFAHGRRILHRDVKPDNVMIGAFGEVYLLDWGVARYLDAPPDPRVVGTPGYMAPEMVADPGTADERTDVFLLGAVLHEVLTGHVLYRGRSIPQLLCAVMLAKPRELGEYPDTAPKVLVDLCIAATQPSASQRPRSVEAFRDALAAYGAHRASQEIAFSALAKLEEAERRIVASESTLADTDIGVLLAESRFGFEQSLQQWADNSIAAHGLQSSLERSCERELQLRNAPAARVLLAAFREARPALVARVEALERELDEARNAEAEHARQARDMDSTVSAIPRLVFLAVFMLVGVGVSIAAYLDEQRTGHMMSMAEQAQLDVTIFTFLTFGLLVGRRWLLTNTFNRMSWALWYLAVVFVTASDSYMWHVGVNSQQSTPLGFGVVAIVFTIGAVTLSRPLGFVAATVWLTSVLSGIFPSAATLIATTGLFLAIAVNMEVTRRVAARAAAAK